MSAILGIVIGPGWRRSIHYVERKTDSVLDQRAYTYTLHACIPAHALLGLLLRRQIGDLIPIKS